MRWYNRMSIHLHEFTQVPRRRSKLLWASSLGAGGLLYLKVWLPLTKLAIPCVFHELTGLYCPGCGMTRTVLALLKFDFAQAFRYNPLLFSLLPLYATYLIATNKRTKLLGNVTMTIMLILTLIFGVLRNIPYFDYLAPTVIR